MENEKISFEMTKDVLSNNLKIFVKSEIIDKALTELKRTDKSNLAIIQDTIKILENGFNVPLEKINPGPGMVSNLSVDLYTPLKAEPIPNTVEMGHIVLPDIYGQINDSIKVIDGKIGYDDLISAKNNNIFKGGMN